MAQKLQTPKRIATLTAMWKDPNARVTDIEAACGVKSRTLFDWARRLGLGSKAGTGKHLRWHGVKHWSPEQFQRFIEMWKAGCSPNEIANVFGFKKSWIVQRYALRLGLIPADQKRCPVCERFLPQDAFTPTNWRRSGAPCKSCRRLRVQERNAERAKHPHSWGKDTAINRKATRAYHARHSGDPDYVERRRQHERKYKRTLFALRNEYWITAKRFKDRADALNTQHQLLIHNGKLQDAALIALQIEALSAEWTQWLAKFSEHRLSSQAIKRARTMKRGPKATK
jgi:hypothetical protein